MTTTPVESVGVAPFGATATGAWSLVPEARLYTGPMPPPVGVYAITAAQVAAWVAELTDHVSMILDGWERLANTPVLDDTGAVILAGDRDRLVDGARTIIHNGAASYLEAARHPERASGYAVVLWDRYTQGLDRLAGWLTARLADLEAGDVDAGDPVTGGPGHGFPLPLFGDGLLF